jgi:hypothetical protein
MNTPEGRWAKDFSEKSLLEKALLPNATLAETQCWQGF